MTSSDPLRIKVPLKKRGRGRPSTGGAHPKVDSRMPPDLLEALENWAKKEGVSRGKAICLLLWKALDDDQADQ